MADEITGTESVEELRAILAAKQNELQDVRQTRLETEAERASKIEAAQLRAEINRVQGNINLEVSQLDVSLNQDPDAIGAGTLTVNPEPKVEPTVPEVPQVPLADPVASEGAPSNEGGK